MALGSFSRGATHIVHFALSVGLRSLRVSFKVISDIYFSFIFIFCDLFLLHFYLFFFLIYSLNLYRYIYFLPFFTHTHTHTHTHLLRKTPLDVFWKRQVCWNCSRQRAWYSTSYAPRQWRSNASVCVCVCVCKLYIHVLVSCCVGRCGLRLHSV